MRALRRRMMFQSTYEPLEYIRNTSNAYIATRFTPDINSSFLYTFAYDVFTNDDCFGVGSYAGGWGLHTHGAYPGKIGYTFGRDLEVHFDCDNSKHSFGLIGNQVIYDSKAISTFTRINPDKTWPLLIFCAHLPLPGNFQRQRVYGLKLWDGDTLVHNFIPVRCRSDGVIGMYDLVGRMFYTSPNGVAFSGGVNHRAKIVSLFEPVAERRAA